MTCGPRRPSRGGATGVWFGYGFVCCAAMGGRGTQTPFTTSARSLSVRELSQESAWGHKPRSTSHQ